MQYMTLAQESGHCMVFARVLKDEDKTELRSVPNGSRLGGPEAVKYAMTPGVWKKCY
ncbi:hypothetical protein M404DRAFT_1004668 [Pisolithus tinctorius Marx 270]|uniref:Uncharacterized protein n=1 Tax=Pisolithus tinctorius Marx 270 TaxID=870435 RepID=A0A0C3NW25_PISTI|nr:hypothetical protein M404DRAFT_1004668 [Pisolithus tinctorius Marx 270]